MQKGKYGNNSICSITIKNKIGYIQVGGRLVNLSLQNFVERKLNKWKDPVFIYWKA